MEWFRWYHSTVMDSKFTVISRRAKQHRTIVLSVWAAILEHASSRRERGSLNGLDSEEIAACLDVEVEQVEAIISAMGERGMIVDGQLKNWAKRQPKREDETAAERKEKWKQKQRSALPEKPPGTHPERNGTQRNANGTVGTCKNRTEQNRTEHKNLIAAAPCEEEVRETEPPEVAPEAEPPPLVRHETLSILEFRHLYCQTTGELLPGGLNNSAAELCRKHPREKIEAAFQEMAECGGKTYRYLAQILAGTPKSRDRPTVPAVSKGEQRVQSNLTAAAEALRIIEGVEHGPQHANHQGVD